MSEERDFSNREISHFFEEIRESLRNQDKVLSKIEKQVTETNGRVTKLESWRETVMGKITGVIATVGVAWILVKEFLLK